MHPEPDTLSRLCRKLLQEYGEVREWIADFPLHALADDPLDELIATVLSQATNDRNSSRAFTRLKASFPDWEDVLAAPEEEVAAAIACGGLGRQKARSIKAILARLKAERGSLSLGFLALLQAAEARRYLMSLPGVGPKTAACVQLFSLGQRAFPVDTHIHRVGARLGFVPAKLPAAKAQALLEGAVPAADCLPLHLLLIQHGRRFCRPSNPRCGACPLRDECPSAPSPL
ncbi:MAG: endonuclease III domain-containing protein [Patescibacteria group bacterium]